MRKLKIFLYLLFIGFAVLRKIATPGPGGLGSDVGEESSPELCRHQAIQDEVDRAVGEGQHVHDLPQWVVAGDEELFTKNGRQHPQYPLLGKTR